MQIDKISVSFELKALAEVDGEFSGVASPYGVRDLGNDVVERSAFSKSIAERGSRVRLLDSHRTRIGVASVKEAERGLEMKGRINLDKQAGRDAYSDLKFYRDNGQPLGLSIGYESVRDTIKNGVRHLLEVKLWEISITEFPMAETALVQHVKHAHGQQYEEGVVRQIEKLRSLFQEETRKSEQRMLELKKRMTR